MKSVGNCANFRWVFGLIDPKSMFTSLYFCTNRKSENLYEYIKNHCVPGSCVYSDSAAQYTVVHGRKSALAKFGYYHFWVNHSDRYTDDKFTFINTSKIELTWLGLKRYARGIGIVKSAFAI
jgi:hypothetical protein